MALWRVLDIYKRAASRRGQAPAKQTHLNSDKKVNSKPSETGRSPLNRLAIRPVILRTAAYFEFYSFSIFRVFSLRFVSGGVSHAPSFFIAAKLLFYPFSSMTLLLENVKKPIQNLFQPIHAFFERYCKIELCNGFKKNSNR